MKITYKDIKNIPCNIVEDLFLSLKWLSSKYPERLSKAINNSDSVFSAWDGEKLVGLVNVLDDSELTAYIHYLLVNPKYQAKGIGSKLLSMVKEKYKAYLYIILISETEKTINFYEKNGFQANKNCFAMNIINK
ncbi:GNAT family N-acetyltransferase [Treponema sp. R80B11-R83G3]